MKHRLVAPVTIAAAMFAVASSNAFAGPRGTVTAPVNNVVFEVGTRGSGISDYLWCGAANFARRSLGAGWRDDIYLVRGRGKGEVTNKGTAAQFTLDPAAAGVSPLPEGQAADTMTVGFSMSVQRANSLCSVPPDMSL